MRIAIALFLVFAFLACRTTKQDDQRHFAEGKDSDDNVATFKAGPPPPSNPGQVPAPFPKPADPLEKGAFYGLCVAKNQLTSPQSLTVKALLAATHQNDCAAAENWLRDQRNKSLRVDSEELVELQSLKLLQNYPHIVDVYIKKAKGIEPVCPLGKDQTCHFLKADFE